MVRATPILLYHAVSNASTGSIAEFTVSPGRFAEQLDAIVDCGAQTLTVSEYVDAIRRDRPPLADRTVLVTFDDGYADTHDAAVPQLLARGIRSTVYVTTGYLGRQRGPGGLAMLDDARLAALAQAGVEIGGHTHSHPQLDVIPARRASEEIVGCKRTLESALGRRVRTFAYPHGYSSPNVRRLVRAAGYDSACAVMNALANPAGDPFRIARLTVTATTTTSEIAGWIAGAGRSPAPRTERLQTRAWRTYRRCAVRLGIRPTVEC
ncbi:MAG: polysaccharide deacetylase family protein [Solirubrobacterales bacterium]|nr:polysaccharide deacetylase family protein [Solirubrobacterales bacterium]